MKKLSLLASYLQFDLLTTDAGGVNLNLGWFSAFNSSCWWDGSVSPVTEEGERPAKRFDQAWPPPLPGQIPDSYHDRWTRTARLSSQRSDLLLKPLRRAEPSALSGKHWTLWSNSEHSRSHVLLHLSSWSLNPGFGLFPSLRTGSWHVKKWFCDF